VAKGNWYMLAGLVVVLLLLAYGCLGGSDAPLATTTVPPSPPATTR